MRPEGWGPKSIGLGSFSEREETPEISLSVCVKAQRRGHRRTQREGVRPQARKRGFSRS